MSIRTYKKAVVAYLDILNFKEVVDNRLPDRIIQIFDEINKIINELRDHSEGDHTIYTSLPESFRNGIVPKISVYSDSILITSGDNPEGQDRVTEYWLLISIIRRLQFSLLKEGLLLRGAITFGDIFHDIVGDRNKIDLFFGPAFLEAYALENRVKMPTVLVDASSLEEHIKSVPQGRESHEDFRNYINFQTVSWWYQTPIFIRSINTSKDLQKNIPKDLHDYFFVNQFHDRQLRSQYKEHIKKIIKSAQNAEGCVSDEKIRNKLNWIISFYNKSQET